MMRRSSSASVCWRVALCACVIPALLTQMSTRPSFSCANLAKPSTSSACPGKLCQHAAFCKRLRGLPIYVVLSAVFSALHSHPSCVDLLWQRQALHCDA